MTSEELKNSIMTSVKEVIKFSQKINDDVSLKGIEDLINDWYFAKEKFIDKFAQMNNVSEDGLRIIFPEKITLYLDEDTKKRKYNDFLNDLICHFNTPDLYDFVDRLGIENFYNNTVDKDFYNENAPKNVIKKGSKLLKSFKFFEQDKYTLDAIQTKASMILQSNKVNGYLCISVHPLDFLSSSENTNNWRSCHSLDGEFRAGNLSYMLDSSTVICYLCNDPYDSKTILPHFPESVPWNNKLWRMLLFFSDEEETVFAGRQYPFTSSTALDTIKNLFLNSYDINTDDTLYPEFTHFKKWSHTLINEIEDEEKNKVQLDDKYMIWRKKLFPLNSVIKDNYGSLHYNDLLYSTVYTPYYTYTNYESYNRKEKKPILHIGGDVKCMCCGENDPIDSGYMLCQDCELDYSTEMGEGIAECGMCGHRFVADDGEILTETGELICLDCAKNECFTCTCCGRLFTNENQSWSSDVGGWLCPDCYDEISKEIKYGKR